MQFENLLKDELENWDESIDQFENRAVSRSNMASTENFNKLLPWFQQ